MGAVSNTKNIVVSLSGVKLNALVLLLTIPLWALASGSYVWVFGYLDYLKGIRDVLNIKIFIILFLGIPLHEFLHALTWMTLQREGFKNVTFGFNWQALTPYTHYSQPMRMWKYRWGGAVPGLLMGIIPAIISLIWGLASLNFIGFLFLWSATGDIISLWMTRKYKSSQWVQDHPNEMGAIIMD